MPDKHIAKNANRLQVGLIGSDFHLQFNFESGSSDTIMNDNRYCRDYRVTERVMERDVLKPTTTISLSEAELNAQPAAPPSSRRFLLWVLYLITFGLLAWFLYEGYSYYLTPYAERPHQEGYRMFRPAGSVGLAYGIAGSVMMVLMLVYSLRKRTRLLGRTIPLRTLLDFHIYLGVVGPLLIVLHTSFKVQGLVAISFWSMVAVAASGYFGRYLYSQVPRNLMGDELSLQELETAGARIANELKLRFQLDDTMLARVDQLFATAMIHKHRGAWASVISLLFDDLMRPFTRRRLRRKLAAIIVFPGRQGRELFETSFQRTILRRRVALLGQVQQLFHYWHVIHKPFAIIMYIIMIIHIGVALWTGYGWF